MSSSDLNSLNLCITFICIYHQRENIFYTIKCIFYRIVIYFICVYDQIKLINYMHYVCHVKYIVDTFGEDPRNIKKNFCIIN